jgi:thiamine-phosphate pyrophosphorylase
MLKLIVLSNPVNITNEHQVVRSLFDAGLNYFHLRKPSAVKGELENFIERIPEKYHERIVLHSHVELMERFDLKGIHYSVLTPEVNTTRFFSTSFHTFEEIEQCKYRYDYAFLSPVFNSISKPGYQAAFNKIELQKFLNDKQNLIALGGIDEHTIPEAIEMGFSGLAVLGALWNAKDPLKKFNCLQNSMYELQK